jgi:hypothetical protein
MPGPTSVCADMERLEGLDGEAVELDRDDGRLVSLKDGTPQARLPLDDWRGTDIRPFKRRRVPLIGPKQACLQVIFKFDVWVALVVPEERSSEVHRFDKALRKALGAGR